MAEHEMRELQGPEAAELTELNLMGADIQAAIANLEILRDKYLIEGDDFFSERGLIANSLFHSAVVRFIGCFDSTDKARRLEADSIFGTSGPERDTFGALRDVRNAFVAHRFGPMRQSIVGVAITSQKRYSAEHVLIYQHPDRAEIERSLKVMRLALAAWDRRRQLASDAVAKIVKAMSREALEKLPVAQLFGDIHINEIKMTREKFAASRAGRNDGIRITATEQSR